jgi:hypothetical protein
MDQMRQYYEWCMTHNVAPKVNFQNWVQWVSYCQRPGGPLLTIHQFGWMILYN